MLNYSYNSTNSDHFKRFSDDGFIILLCCCAYMLIVGHDDRKIDDLKGEFDKSFAMKDLGPPRLILGAKISCMRRMERFSCHKKRAFKRFSVSKSKTVSSPPVGHFKLNFKQCPTSNKEKERNEACA